MTVYTYNKDFFQFFLIFFFFLLMKRYKNIIAFSNRPGVTLIQMDKPARVTWLPVSSGSADASRRGVHKQRPKGKKKKKKSRQNCSVRAHASVFFFPPQPVGARHTMSWFWAPLIVKAHYQSLGDRSGPAQRLPALRIIWALDRKLLLWHTQKARDSGKEHFCLTLWAQRWRSIPKVSLLVTGCHQWE